MKSGLLRITIAVLVAVALLGGVAFVSAADTDDSTDVAAWMHDTAGEHVPGEYHGQHHDEQHHNEYHDDKYHEEHHDEYYEEHHDEYHDAVNDTPDSYAGTGGHC